MNRRLVHFPRQDVRVFSRDLICHVDAALLFDEHPFIQRRNPADEADDDDEVCAIRRFRPRLQILK